MKYFIRQLGQKDCAFACLKMLLAITHKNKDYLYYQQNDIDRSYSLEEIIKLVTDNGIAIACFIVMIFDHLKIQEKMLNALEKMSQTLNAIDIRIQGLEDNKND